MKFAFVFAPVVPTRAMTSADQHGTTRAPERKLFDEFVEARDNLTISDCQDFHGKIPQRNLFFLGSDFL